jgi:threonine dehydratase
VANSFASGLQAEDVLAAACRLHGVAVRTPVVRVGEFDRRCGASIFLKCENLQRIGAFKFRGAYNRLAQMSAHERRRGVVAFSSGNHAQGVALAARLLGIAATIVMPRDAPAAKRDATLALGARIVDYDREADDREAMAARIVEESGALLVPPYDDYQVMAGQGTAALELCTQAGELDALVVPLGGGGLLAGCAVAARHLQPGITLLGAEPQTGNDWQLSLARGSRVSVPPPQTICDGLRSMEPGRLPWPIVQRLANGVLTVGDEEVRCTMRDLFEHARLIVEPSGAVAVAAVLAHAEAFRGRRVGVVISGGNVDPGWYCRLVGRRQAGQNPASPQGTPP